MQDLIPPTVADQIRLWQLERDRFTFTAAVAYSQFDGIDDYQDVLAYAVENGSALRCAFDASAECLRWSSDDARMIVVDESKHDDVKAYFKRRKKERNH